MSTDRIGVLTLFRLEWSPEGYNLLPPRLQQFTPNHLSFYFSLGLILYSPSLRLRLLPRSRSFEASWSKSLVFVPLFYSICRYIHCCSFFLFLFFQLPSFDALVACIGANRCSPSWLRLILFRANDKVSFLFFFFLEDNEPLKRFTQHHNIAI